MAVVVEVGVDDGFGVFGELVVLVVMVVVVAVVVEESAG